jgi:hypothetical protein
MIDYLLSPNLLHLFNERVGMGGGGERERKGTAKLGIIINQNFRNLPGHSSKECILIISSLTTIDAANLKQIYEVFQYHTIVTIRKI